MNPNSPPNDLPQDLITDLGPAIRPTPPAAPVPPPSGPHITPSSSKQMTTTDNQGFYKAVTGEKMRKLSACRKMGEDYKKKLFTHQHYEDYKFIQYTLPKP